MSADRIFSRKSLNFQTGCVNYLSDPIDYSEFESAYIALREKEGRIYDLLPSCGNYRILRQHILYLGNGKCAGILSKNCSGI